MKAVSVENSVGMVLGHDLTRIVPGESKGAAFKKGHIITEEDVPMLLSMGKEHIFALELSPGTLHEDEAAQRLASAACGQGLTLTSPSEGRVNLVAMRDGLLKINTAALDRLNALESVVFATLHTNHRVRKDTIVAGTRVVPLMIAETRIEMAETICEHASPVVQILPFLPKRVGVVVTGSEIYHGRIKDKFGPVVEKKFKNLGSTVIGQKFSSDDIGMTVEAIHELVSSGAEFIVLTGGMSVDPDDQTPSSIRAAGAQVVTYGAPILPGAMFMLAYLGDIPVVGLPGCVMYHNTSIFDLVVPRLLAGETLKREDISRLGHGGLCRSCDVCRYPECSFGKL